MTCTYVSAIKHCFDSVWKFSSGRNSLFTSFLYAFRCNELRCLSCFTDSPAVVSQSSLLASAPGTPDLLVNSLELKRTLRKWSHDKEKVKEDGIIGDCFLVDICFSPSRSSQVNPNSTRPRACGGNLPPTPLVTIKMSIKTWLKLEIARAMSLAPRVPVRCQCFVDMF